MPPPPPPRGPSAHFYWGGGVAYKSEETSPPWVNLMGQTREGSNVPFICHKNLLSGKRPILIFMGMYYRAWMERSFASLWSWRVVRDIWLGSHEDFCCSCHVHVCFPREWEGLWAERMWCCPSAAI